MAQNPEPRSGDRIAKLLARAGIASRREVERMIADGRVALNGTIVDTPATVLTSLTGVTVDGQPVALPEPTRLFLYHKPTGLLVTEHDPAGRPIIYDKLPPDLPRVMPVGRLDLNTEGLLLLTTDGGFKRQLELPSTGVERSYRARAYGNVTQQQLEELAEGVEIEGIRYGPIDANIERRTGANVWIEVTITEGKNREVRRVLEYLDLQVSRLIRTRYGPFVLGDLPIGAVGEVKQNEMVAFRRTLKGGAPDEPIGQAPRDGFRTAPTTTRTARPRPRPIEVPVAPATQERPARARPTGGDGPRTVRPTRPGFQPASGRRTASEAADARGRSDEGRPARFARTDRSDRSDASGRRSPRHDREERSGGRTRSGETRMARPERPNAPRTTGGRSQRGEAPVRIRDERPDARESRGRGRETASPRSERTDRGDRPARPAGRPPRNDAAPSRGPAGGRGSPRPKTPGGRPPAGAPRGGRK